MAWLWARLARGAQRKDARFLADSATLGRSLDMRIKDRERLGMASRIAVVLSGSGFLDGAEIQESVLTLFFLDRARAKVRCFAPDQAQMHVVDHGTQTPTEENRNVRVESARIARTQVEDIKALDMAEFDALVLPGGFGVAKNLSNFAIQGAQGSVQEDLKGAIAACLEQKKPIVAMCIAPAIVALVLRDLKRSAALTIGRDADTAAAIEACGCTHQPCSAEEIVWDESARIISTPAYMLGESPAPVGAGIEAAISKLWTWIA